jgi:hypothetical protein
MASSAPVITIQTPTDGVQISNNGSNVARYDINFTITDANSISFDTNGDYNVNITYYLGTTGKLWNGGTASDANVTYVVRDGNINDWNRNGNNTARRCTGINNHVIKCWYKWTIPDDTVMGGGKWVLDVNVFEFGKVGTIDTTNSDGNASAVLNISNRLGTMDTAKGIANMMPFIMIGAFFIGLFGALFVAKTNITTAVLAGVGGGIVGALGCMLFGMLLAIV